MNLKSECENSINVTQLFEQQHHSIDSSQAWGQLNCLGLFSQTIFKQAFPFHSQAIDIFGTWV